MRIVVAEDHQMFREVLRRVCGEFGHEVVGEAEDGPGALRVTMSTEPDVLLLDLNLPGMDGFGVFEILRKATQAVRVIALTSARGAYTAFRVDRAGFAGFVDKNTTSLESLRAAIEAVGSGRSYFSNSYVRMNADRRRNPGSFDKVLSDRELAVLELIGNSLSDEEIADRLGIHPKTAETHRQRIMDKLNLHGTPKLIRFAIESGFTQVTLSGDTARPASP